MEHTLTKTWDLDTIYPGGKQSEKLLQQFSQLESEIPILIDQLQPPLPTKEIVQLLDKVQNVILLAFQIDEYCICLSSEDIHDQEAMKLMDRSKQLQVMVKTLEAELDGFYATLSEEEWNQLLDSDALQSIRSYLQEKQKSNKLPQKIENAINTLSINGIKGWEDHYEQLFYSLEVQMQDGDETKNIPLYDAYIQAFFDQDRKKRIVANKAIQTTLIQHKESFASIFNHFAGFRLDTYKLKGIEHTQAEFYEKNRIKEGSVSSMMDVLRENREHHQKFLKRKAELMGLDQLSYFDIDLPFFSSKSSIDYEEAAEIVTKQFQTFSEEMGAFAERAFREQWIDAEPRKNKDFSAFCAAMPLEGQSRILLSFEGNYQDVVTLAHEIGHAYHNMILQSEAAFTQETGSALAETASTFVENLVLDAAIEHAPTEEDQLSLLEMKISNANKYISSIPYTFDFEQQFYEKRKQEKVSADEISNLMVETEKRWTTNALREYNPYNWMTISHFYTPEKPFYTLSYSIGYLFSNGIYVESKKDDKDFHNQYVELLRHTGKMPIEELGATFLNQDLSKKEFWEKAIKPINEAIEQFISLTDKYVN
ncbi:M3 family oligoendopeptidase [Guptibacillus algicola]|uniref:M3 family oligoendopeptidase n=1 Tax=Guptibacillus algicola TaxID=225844 RepID=UPI001CD7BBB5|nr:M3 family oligoendopeptidase [Alkalihalobacillus algicola]MCA0987470.1 M3 family oligoendopeptidase [Alkalihalobacillus algicola]